jgi:hypothetical protein
MIVKFQDDEEAIVDCIWSISYLADHHKNILKMIEKLKKLPLIVKLLE